MSPQQILKPEYDLFAKQLWVKVYQEELTQSKDHEEAKDIADLAMADYMNSIHGVTSVVKENFDSNNMIQVPFTLDEENDVEFDAENCSTVTLCTKLNRMYIDQTRIKRVWLEIKSEDE